MSILAPFGCTRPALALTVLLALLALGSLALLPAPLAAASGCIGNNTTTTYYSDASKTTVVGSYHSNCQGVCTGSGQITRYYRIFTTDVICPGGGEL